MPPQGPQPPGPPGKYPPGPPVSVVAGQHDAGTWSIDAGAGMHQHFGRRQNVGAWLKDGLMRRQMSQRRILRQRAPSSQQGGYNKRTPSCPKYHWFPPRHRTKFEIRNSKFETSSKIEIPKSQMSKIKPIREMSAVADFDFRTPNSQTALGPTFRCDLQFATRTPIAGLRIGSLCGNRRRRTTRFFGKSGKSGR